MEQTQMKTAKPYSPEFRERAVRLAMAPSRPSIVCPPVVAYDRACQGRLADEIQRLPPGAALEQAMLDYGRLRDQAQACASPAKP